jgi:hypothetical protein
LTMNSTCSTGVPDLERYFDTLTSQKQQI